MRSLPLDLLAKLRFQVVDDSLFQIFPFKIALVRTGRWIKRRILKLADRDSGYACSALVETTGEVTGDVARPGPVKNVFSEPG